MHSDLKTYIVIPSDAPAPKINAVRGYGADVIHSGRTTQSREEVIRLPHSRAETR